MAVPIVFGISSTVFYYVRLCRAARRAAVYTPLMWATNRKYVLVVRALLAGGADIDAIAVDGSTAVMFTRDSKPESLEILEILCEYNPDISKRDWRGRNLIDEARDRYRCSGNPEMQKVLERFFPEIDFNAS